ncbi:Cacna1g [Symbiodinium natans]|uniref:Cacna1g protein n=1 Tax=Symbiodinium natans TaxID=878477 RepID=A0A812IA01_9DINO|nr:Cacna1g [Symbiodinium natans]
MPRPNNEKIEANNEREWLLSVLDMKFRHQEAVIRELLQVQGLQQIPLHPILDFADGSDTGPGWSTKVQATACSDPPSSPGLTSTQEGQQDYTESHDTSGSQSRVGKKSSKGISKHMKAEMSQQQAADSRCKTFVKGPLDGYLGIVVLLNLGLMAAVAQITGHEADVSLGLSPPETVELGPGFDVAEAIFFTIYVFDVALRMVVLKKEWIYDDAEGIMFMNMFDAVLVLVHGFELLLLPLMVSGDQDQRASTVRVIKLLRIVRTLRIVKTVALFRQLRLLVGTCLASIGALFWSMVMLFLIKLGFALIICQALQGYILDEANDLDTRLEMNNLYGSFLKALYTMFEVTHAGSWPARVRPVVDKVSPWYSLPFLAYITLVVFAVIRVVTALFLKETLASAANDADMQLEENRRTAKNYQQKLEDLFRAVDDDGNGWLSPDEFVQALSLPSVQRYLVFLDLKVSDCRPLFDILDDGDGKITIQEFCKGLMQIKGHARAIDMVVLQRESTKVFKECQDIHNELKAMISTIARLGGKSSGSLSLAAGTS